MKRDRKNTVNKELTKKTLGIFWQHARRYPRSVFFILLGVFLLNALDAYVPLLYRDIINLLSEGEVSVTVFRSAVGILVLILVIHLARMVSRRGSNFFHNFHQPSVMRDLNNTCYRYLQKHSIAFFNSTFVGSLVTRVKRYERAYQEMANQVVYDLGHSLLSLVMILAVLFWQYPLFGTIIAVWSAVFIFVSYLFAMYRLPYDIERAYSDTRTTAQLADSITNNVNIKLFSGYAHENRLFGRVTQDQFKIRKKNWNLVTISDIIQSLMTIGLEFVVIYLSLSLWFRGSLVVGDLVLLQLYIFPIFHQLWRTGRNMQVIYESLADANEMTEILLMEHAVKDKRGAKELEVRKGEIIFKDTVFKYKEGIEVLSGFDLKI
ncbi:MAG: ABC transporter ATP-binding protein, partial [bacterium]|nr:ABC transporter ATP-binding protein [bacterium]